MKKIIKLIDDNPDVVSYQKNIKRNFGWNSAFQKDKNYMQKISS